MQENNLVVFFVSGKRSEHGSQIRHCSLGVVDRPMTWGLEQMRVYFSDPVPAFSIRHRQSDKVKVKASIYYDEVEKIRKNYV